MTEPALCPGEPIEDRTGDNLLPLSAFQDGDGNWREDWPTIPAFLVCVNEGGCTFAGEATLATLAENVDGRYRSSCGVCGEQTARFHPAPCPDTGEGQTL